MKAFPSPHWKQSEYEGMDLRDYFAAIASEQDIDKYQWNTTVGYGIVSKIEACSREEAKYKYADAMMKAREVK